MPTPLPLPVPPAGGVGTSSFIFLRQRQPVLLQHLPCAFKLHHRVAFALGMLLWQENEHSNVQDKVTLFFYAEALPMVTEMTEVPMLLDVFKSRPAT